MRTTINKKVMVICAVTANFGIDDTPWIVCIGGLKHYCTRTVTKKYTSRAVLPVENTAIDFCADDQGFLCRA